MNNFAMTRISRAMGQEADKRHLSNVVEMPAPAAEHNQIVQGHRGLGRQPSFWIVAATFGLFLFAAAAPSPLYALYAARWRFSPVAVTEVFGIYAIALLVALLLTGSLSDSLGRRHRCAVGRRRLFRRGVCGRQRADAWTGQRGRNR